MISLLGFHFNLIDKGHCIWMKFAKSVTFKWNAGNIYIYIYIKNEW